MSKRSNFPHRKNIRRRAALARLKDQVQRLKGRRWQSRRDILRRVIANTTRNLGDN